MGDFEPLVPIAPIVLKGAKNLAVRGAAARLQGDGPLEPPTTVGGAAGGGT